MPRHGPADEYAEVFRAWQGCASAGHYVLREVLLTLDGGRAPADAGLAVLGSEYFELLPDADAAVAAWCEAEYECTMPACCDVRDPEYRDEARAREDEPDDEDDEQDEDDEPDEPDDEPDEPDGAEPDEPDGAETDDDGEEEAARELAARLPSCLSRYNLTEAHRGHCLCGKPVNSLHVVRHIGTQRVFFVGSRCARLFRAAPATRTGRPKRKCTQKPVAAPARRVRARRSARPAPAPAAARSAAPAPAGGAPDTAPDFARRVLLEVGLALVGLAQRAAT
eukprot:g57709.t1